MLHAHFRDLAAYNAWANRRLYDAIAALPAHEYYADRKAFFGSIHGTLNHLLVIDLLWSGRLAPPAFRPAGYDMIVEEEFSALRGRREGTDTRLTDIVDALSDARLAEALSWTTLEGEAKTAPLHRILTQIFNHQTHHRGQVHCLLSQAGVSPPPLDFYFFAMRRSGKQGLAQTYARSLLATR